jgi:hypothetical protein
MVYPLYRIGYSSPNADIKMKSDVESWIVKALEASSVRFDLTNRNVKSFEKEIEMQQPLKPAKLRRLNSENRLNYAPSPKIKHSIIIKAHIPPYALLASSGGATFSIFGSQANSCLRRKKSANMARLKMKKAQSSKKRARSGGGGRGGDF